MSRYIDYYPCHPFLSAPCGKCSEATKCFQGKEFDLGNVNINQVHRGGAFLDQQQYDSYNQSRLNCQGQVCCEGIIPAQAFSMCTQRWGDKECNRLGEWQYVNNANAGAFRPDARGKPNCCACVRQCGQGLIQ